jgi:ribose transport system permease protein
MPLRNKLKGILFAITNQNVLPWLICVFTFVVMGAINGSIFSSYSVTSLLAASTPQFLMAAGEIIVMLAGSIDLTLANSVGFCCMLAAGIFANTGLSISLVIVMVLIVGCLIGLINGLVITRGKLQSFIVTIAMSVVIKGATLIYSKGTSIPLKSKGLLFSSLLSETFLGVPVYFYIGCLILTVVTIVVVNTVFGRHLRAMGGSEVAARMNGLRCDSLRVVAFVLAGCLYAIAGLIMLVEFGTGWPQAASGWEMDGIAISVLGGANFAGGVGLPIGAIPGAIVLGLILRFLVTIGIDPYWQYAVKGVFLIAVAAALARSDYGR